MADDLKKDAEGDLPEVKVFMARQPIFDSSKNLFAYELLYRSDLENRAYIASDEYATLKVIANSLLIGLQKLTAGKKAFINFDRKLLLAQTPMLFPKESLGVEILETVEPDEYIIKVCTRMKSAGYTVILDNFVFQEKYRPLLKMADIIKMDFRTTPLEEKRAIFERVDLKTVQLLACKIETQDEFDDALAMGYNYFQGFFFQQPSLISRRELPGYKVTYLSILKKIYEPIFDVTGIEENIKRDVSLTYKLLRFINSAAHGFKVTIHSIHHALILLGKRELKRWLTIIVMSGIGREKPVELMKVTVIRARFCELIGLEFHLKEQPSDLFLMGMLSNVGAFLDLPMEDVLAELPVEENIKEGLVRGEGQAGDILKLVIAFEKAEWETVGQMANRLNLEQEKLALLYLDAVEWTKFLTKE
jgi:c-di-GMP-related signal transduction protein